MPGTGDFDVPGAAGVAELAGAEPGEAGQVAGQVGGEPAPQVGGAGVEQDGGGVVVAAGAQRPSESAVAVEVAAGAGDLAVVRAAPGAGVAAGAAGQDVVPVPALGVDRAERRGGEGGEYARVRSDAVGDALAAGQARADELAGVALVDGRAGRADGLAASRGSAQPRSG
ncbi:MAG: hypothetical protein M3Y33_05285 [Actinomycetota bacterium]|nr:hypothetical protein [Actinomycetota bacterium]